MGGLRGVSGVGGLRGVSGVGGWAATLGVLLKRCVPCLGCGTHLGDTADDVKE